MSLGGVLILNKINKPKDISPISRGSNAAGAWRGCPEELPRLSTEGMASFVFHPRWIFPIPR